MEAKIVEKPAFTFVGMSYRGKNQHREIPALWETFVKRMGEIPNHTDEGYGYSTNWDAKTGDFDYVAGFSVTKAGEVPEGMVSVSLPAQKYAVYPTRLSTIMADTGHIYTRTLPQDGLEPAPTGWFFEYYPPEYNGGDEPVELWVPIK
jgi:predicted transcriptional regulator YdeE